MLLTVTLNASLDRAYQIPQFQIGRIFRVADVKVTAGGKGNNVARVAHALGLTVTATGLAGGAVGASIVRRLKALGIKTAFVKVAGESRQCLAVTAGSGKVTEILEPGPHVSPAELRVFKERFAELCRHHRYVILSGSLPVGVPADIYAELIGTARNCGCQAALDAKGEALRQGVKARPWLVKINRQEAEDLLECQLTDTNFIVKVLKERDLADLTIITLGSEGAVLWDARQRQAYKVSSPQVNARNTVGSGDSFLAGFLYCWTNGKDAAASLCMAAACGAANAAEDVTASISREMVTRLMQRARIEIM